VAALLTMTSFLDPFFSVYILAMGKFLNVC